MSITVVEKNTAADISYYRKAGTTTYSSYYCQAISAIALVTATLGRNFLFATPFVVSKGSVTDRIAMEVTGAGTAGSLIRVGIYSNDAVGGNGPGTRLVDAGTIAGDSATFQTLTINQPLNPGLYWVCWVHNSVANIGFRCVPIAGMPNILGSPTTGGAGIYTEILPAFTFAALPASFPAFSATDIVSGITPAIWLRLSS